MVVQNKSGFREAICIVTGAASGIGFELSRQLFAAGAVVIMADVNLAEAEKSAHSIESSMTRAIPVFLDVTQKQQFEEVLRWAVREYGRLDLMCNNAGINRMGDARSIPSQDWEQIIDVNLWGVVHGTRAAYAIMAQQGFGHILNIASGLGITPAPRNVPYALTKAAVVGLSESLRIEARDLGVGVSVACPGWIQTPMLDGPSGHRHGNRGIKRSIGSIACRMPFGIMSVSDAARTILRGVSRRSPMIVFPAYMRIFHWVYSHFRLLTDMWNLQEIRSYRRMSQQSALESQERRHEIALNTPSSNHSKWMISLDAADSQ